MFLGEVQHREVDVSFVFEVFDGKIEPLMVASRVRVDTHVKREISSGRLDDFVQVCGFEIAIELVKILAKVYLSEKVDFFQIWVLPGKRP